MKKSLIALAVLAACYGTAASAFTQDVAFTYRMGAGFPGDINRTHPFSAVAGNMDTALPVRLYGDPAIITATNTYKGLQIADQASVTSIAGVLVRPYPTQQQSGGMSASLGAATPPTGPAVIDILEDGFIMVKCNNFAAAPPVKGTQAFVWCAASAGNQVLGGFCATATGGSTIALTNAEWHSPPDAAGIAELRVWKARKT